MEEPFGKFARMNTEPIPFSHPAHPHAGLGPHAAEYHALDRKRAKEKPDEAARVHTDLVRAHHLAELEIAEARVTPWEDIKGRAAMYQQWEKRRGNTPDMDDALRAVKRHNLIAKKKQLPSRWLRPPPRREWHPSKHHPKLELLRTLSVDDRPRNTRPITQ